MVFGSSVMMSSMRPPFVFLFTLIMILTICYLCKCEARDSISPRNPLSDNGETLVSAGNIFELGFFSPGKGQNRTYLGIWYFNFPPRRTVWVANRDEPLSDLCGIFGIAEDGNIRLWCSDGISVPVTNLESMKASNQTLQLLDSGNLILVDGQSGTRLWQSFDHPTNTFLPGMKLKDRVKLTSWTSSSDPTPGNYTFQQDQDGFSILKGSTFYWRSGEPGTSTIYDLLPSYVRQLLSGGNESISYSQINSSYIRLQMKSSGEIQYFNSSVDHKDWNLLWSEPSGNRCSIHNACGNFSFCNDKGETMCECPQGFEPASLKDWNAGEYSGGCVRGSKMCSKQDSFLNLLQMEVLGEVVLYDQVQREEACKEECLNNCQCNAYSYIYANVDARSSGKSAFKCWIWTNEVVNLHQDYDYGRFNLSLRVPPPTLATGKDLEASKNKSHKRYVIIITVIVSGVALVAFLSYMLYRRRRRAERSGNQDTPALLSNENERRLNNFMHENNKCTDVPFDEILSATDNFSDANKLGEGGFGPVYKGKFPRGQEFAVKRLSSSSSQGLGEFQNEVFLIAELQHRNLVRLLGYCNTRSEKILLYEYMPNRSLDAFIFDPHNSLLLDWKKRFDIILGIARGLLYLHQDSRLRIIHRDLKTSNILLDEDMNPKICDFGLARIIEGKGTETSTQKAAGTRGYMSPEYAWKGKFSTKSDVFSFGVVILEIISGKKIMKFYPHEDLNLLGHTWKLWSEDKALDSVNPTLLGSCNKSQVMKCIKIGLLCVQDDPNERPSMSTVVTMLDSETDPLPLPSEPHFVVTRHPSTASSSSSTKPEMISKNELTISILEGR